MNTRWKVLKELDMIGTSAAVPAKILTMKIGRQLTPFFDNFEFEAKYKEYGDIVASNSREWWRKPGALSFVKCRLGVGSVGRWRSLVMSLDS